MIKFLTSIIAVVLFTGFTLNKNVSKPNMVNVHEYLEEGEQYPFCQVLDSSGMPLYYYREVRQYPCKNENVCKMMYLTMYYDVYGRFLQFKMKENKPLTKLNHKAFNEKDYKQLHKILNNPNSELKYCKYDNLTSQQCENQYHVDAVSGATMTDIEFEYINGAIKTTYALWKIANGNITDSIRHATEKTLLQLSETVNGNSAFNFTSETQFWNTYKSADKYEKILLVMKLQSNVIDLHTKQEMVYEEINAQEELISGGWLNVLSLDELQTKALKENILPILTSTDSYTFMAAYNMIQRSGQNRMLKNYELDIWTSKQ